MPIAFDIPTKQIQLTSPTTIATLQEIINATRLHEETFQMMSEAKVIDAFGKQPLGGGKLVGITMVLLNSWTIKADDQGGPSLGFITVTGGNLVADVGVPLTAAAFVSYIIEQDTSAALIQSDALESGAGSALIDVSIDPTGWVERRFELATTPPDTVEAERFELYDQDGVRITAMHNPLDNATVMIAERRRIVIP